MPSGDGDLIFDAVQTVNEKRTREVDVRGAGYLGLSVSSIGTGVITPRGRCGKLATFAGIQAEKRADGTKAATINADGVWVVRTAGLSEIELEITTVVPSPGVTVRAWHHRGTAE